MLSGLHGLGDLGGRRKGWAHSTPICFRALSLNGLLLLWLKEISREMDYWQAENYFSTSFYRQRCRNRK